MEAFMEGTMRKLLLAAACLSWLGCGEGTKTTGPKTTLTIGALVPLTGGNSDAYWLSAITMAVDQMNAALEASPKSANIQFKLVYRDDQGVNAVADTLAREMAGLGALVLYSNASGTSARANGLNYD